MSGALLFGLPVDLVHDPTLIHAQQHIPAGSPLTDPVPRAEVWAETPKQRSVDRLVRDHDDWAVMHNATLAAVLIGLAAAAALVALLFRHKVIRGSRG